MTHILLAGPMPLRWLLVCVALGVVCAFECVNGFHDTANAMATVIYTRTLRPWGGPCFGGFWNFLGVYLGGVTVAFSIVHLLPVDLLLQINTHPGLANRYKGHPALDHKDSGRSAAGASGTPLVRSHISTPGLDQRYASSKPFHSCEIALPDGCGRCADMGYGPTCGRGGGFSMLAWHRRRAIHHQWPANILAGNQLLRRAGRPGGPAPARFRPNANVRLQLGARLGHLGLRRRFVGSLPDHGRAARAVTSPR